ncbi:MAG: double-strand break repair helicase AddA [Rhodobacteraceae bacterium]|nr:double-strand break repair helicase AddA [Paracoccaceae bacterium]MCP5341425.1 double-strand break repair helicase AddA [Paracoccaceae bacterium]
MQDAATQRQIRAADPGQSAWLSANAGSGKTRVLTDRVARLLLAGTEPQRILCLTYTKAAASEMQNRLLARLGEWAMLPEPTLMETLRELDGEGAVDPGSLAKARRLFARAIETPGGLKIQTIHSFCASLLRRFPLEARVSPNFTELDDHAARLLRDEIAEELAAGEDRDAFDAIASLFSGQDLSGILADISRNSDAFSKPMGKKDAFALFDLPKDACTERMLSDVFLGDEAALFADLVPVLLASGKNDSGAGRKLGIVDFNRPDFAVLSVLEDVLLYGANAKAGPFSAKLGSFPTKGLRDGPVAHLMPGLEALMKRVETARSRRVALAAAEKTFALHRFARAFLPRYEARKAAGGWLDFDDLIHGAAALLSERSVAAWVLFRLDGGIDHILVDEAQDTSPGQWQVIERLAEEFTAGEGARDQGRTIFVVGDKKQSIYSFQGADLAAFDRMHDHFRARHDAAGTTLLRLTLEHSFRSSEAILRLVDLTFDERVNRGLGGEFKHLAFQSHLPGRVDLWAPVPSTPKPEPENWYDPRDLLSDEHEVVLLARTIAGEIRRMIHSGVQIETRTGPRPVHEGDFLILVQRRSDLFQEIIRACKALRLQVAGADRLKLGAELAVKDIAALLSFLSLPEDDLSLAVLLRSPFFGWSESMLYGLAHGRGEDEYLWAALRNRVADFPDTLAVLQDMRDQAEFLRPYDLIERALTRHDGRRRLLARLGPEAEDGIDALLGQALAYEQIEAPSLTGFLSWMETDDVEVKRRLDSASRSIRVMTVHGAKGLESPIVILPDTAKRTENLRDEIYRVDDGKAVWRTTVSESPALISNARAALLERQREERLRLLYVAMTRAESWLIVCAAGDVGSGAESWYSLIKDGMDKAGAVEWPGPVNSAGSGPGKRIELGNWPEQCRKTASDKAPEIVLPDWIHAPECLPAGAEKPLSPSALGGVKALPGEAGLEAELAMRRGTWLHLLLEHLPGWPVEDWPRIAQSLLLSCEEPASEAEAQTILDDARRVLTSDDMAALLVPGSLQEVELTASVPELGGRRMHGTIDRLVIDESRILAVDYKSNAIVPDSVADVPEGILRQMGAYAAMLGQIYPEKRIETAVFWTKAGRLMPLPADIVRAALQSATIT